MWVISSSDSFLRMVVLPALSKPKTKIRASWSLRFSLRSNVKSPILLRCSLVRSWVLRVSKIAQLCVWERLPSPSFLSLVGFRSEGRCVPPRILVLSLLHRQTWCGLFCPRTAKESSGRLFGGVQSSRRRGNIPRRNNLSSA